MATTFGLVVSVGSIIQIVESCIELYGDILSIKQRNRDVTAFNVRLQVEQFRFKGFQDAVKSNSLPELLEKSTLQYLCKTVMDQIEADLKSIHYLIVRHGIGAKRSDRVEPVKSGSRRVAEKVKRGLHSTTWVANDKQRLLDLLTRLREYNDTLLSLMSEGKRQRTEFGATSAAIASNDPARLKSVVKATEGHDEAVAKGAEVKKMVLLASGDLTDVEESRLGKEVFRLSLHDFEWLPPTTNELFSLQTLPQITLDQACCKDRAYAKFFVTPGPDQKKADTQTTQVPVLVEWRDSFRSEETLAKFAYRLDYLVTVLRKMSSTPTNSHAIGHQASLGYVLPCIGWITTSQDFDRIGLVFSLPDPQPQSSIFPAISCDRLVVSLNQLLVQTRKQKTLDPPPLGVRFDLARALVFASAKLISVGWIHKELRSHNVLLPSNAKSNYDFSNPYLAGLTYARPTKETATDVSTVAPSLEYELYRPSSSTLSRYLELVPRQTFPDVGGLHLNSASSADSEDDSENIGSVTTVKSKIDIQSFRWTSAMDVYGLGIILLEIGFWRTILDLKRKASNEDFVERDLESLVDSLSYRMGGVYCGIVKKCLKLGEWVNDQGQEIEFFGGVIEELARCKA